MADDDELLKSFSFEDQENQNENHELRVDDEDDVIYNRMHTEMTEASRQADSREPPSDDFLEVYNEGNSERRARETETNQAVIKKTHMTGEVRSPQFFCMNIHEHDSSQGGFSIQ